MPETTKKKIACDDDVIDLAEAFVDNSPLGDIVQMNRFGMERGAYVTDLAETIQKAIEDWFTDHEDDEADARRAAERGE